MSAQHAVSSLGQALAKIDELLAALKNGTLLSTGAPAQKAAAAAGRQGAPLKAAPAAATATAAPQAAAPKQGKKEKKEKPAKPAAAPAPEGDAFDKAHLVVSGTVKCIN